MKSRFRMEKMKWCKKQILTKKDKYLAFRVTIGGCGEVSASCLRDTKMMKSITMTAFYPKKENGCVCGAPFCEAFDSAEKGGSLGWFSSL